MNKLKIPLSVISFLIIILFQSCTDMLCVLSGYKPSDIKGNLQTPEPGTQISARCNLITKYVEKFSANPDSMYRSNKKYLNIFKPRVNNVHDINIAASGHDIPARIYCDVRDRQRENLPVIIFYHGGGFVWGSTDVFDRLCRKMATETETVFVSVDYRLAPEYPFPAAINDSYRALKWVKANIRQYGGDPDKIIVMGESAGGNLAAAMPLVSRDSCGPGIIAQVIICGALTFEETIYPSRKYFLSDDRSYLVSEGYLHRCKSQYLQNNVEASHSYVSPLSADIDIGMPPAMIITAQCDPLRDEGREYAAKLQEAGINVMYREYEGMIHAFMNFYPFLDKARMAINDVDAFIDTLAYN